MQIFIEITEERASGEIYYKFRLRLGIKIYVECDILDKSLLEDTISFYINRITGGKHGSSIQAE